MLRSNDDRGAALVFALAALAIVAVLGAVVVDRAGSELRSAERSVDRTRAEVLIDVAVSSAWGRIESGATVGFTDAGSTPTGSWAYTARPVGDHRWDIAASAGEGVDEVRAAVVIARDAIHPYTLFAENISTGPLTGRVGGRVGATGDIAFRGRALGDVQELVKPDGRCRGCDNPVVVELPRARPEVPPVANARPCPDIAGEIAGPLEAGDPYLCDSPGVVTFVGDVHVSGPVIFVLGRDVGLDLADASINAGGVPSDLVIRQADARDVSITSSGATLAALIVAPFTPMRTGDLTWRGAIDVQSFAAADGADLDGDWDPDLIGLGLGAWRVVGWDLSRN